MEQKKIVIDLNKDVLAEGWQTPFARDVKMLLGSLYAAGINVPATIRGTQSQIESFFKALRNEKSYMDAYMQHGLGDPRTLETKGQLMSTIKKFEQETGLVWPFKN
jgi:hypothetical protein